MPIYMKYGDLTGDVTVAGFEGWIEVDSFSFGVSRPATSPGSSAGKVSISDISITKVLDKTSVPLLSSSFEGTSTDTVTLEFLKVVKGSSAFIKGSGGTVAYLKYQLTDTLVSSYSLSSGGDTPQESLTLNFAKLQTTFTSQNGSSSTTGIDENTDEVS